MTYIGAKLVRGKGNQRENMSEFVQGVRTNGRVDNKMLVMNAQQGLYMEVKMIKSK